MSQYLAEEIKKFHSRTIPLVDYPFEVKLLRDKINKFTQLKQLYIKRMLYNKEIDETEYEQLSVIIEHERVKYQRLVNWQTC